MKELREISFSEELKEISFSEELKELKELSLPAVAEELRQQPFWRSFLSSKTYVLTP